jgi:putative transcriptional regulator
MNLMKSPKNRKPLFERLKTGLEEAILHTRGEITLKTTTLEMPDRPSNVRADELTKLRLESGMSQAVFAQVLNVSTKTVQSWEQGSRKPSWAALRLIQVFRQNPSVVLQTVGMSGGTGDTASAKREGKGVGGEEGLSLNSAFLTPKPPASSVYVLVLEAPSPRKQSRSVASPFLSPSPCPFRILSPLPSSPFVSFVCFVVTSDCLDWPQTCGKLDVRPEA